MKTIFKLRNRAITLLGVALSVAGCSGSGGHSIDPTPTPTPTPTPGGEIAVTSVTISTGKGYLEKGGTLALEAEVKPANATNKTITWSSTNTSVATVTSDGIISAKAAGTTTIKATAGGKSASCTVTVLDAAIDLSLMDIYGNTVSRTTANCYVVSKPGFYKIPMVYGNAIKNGATNRGAYVSLASGETILTNFLDHKGAGIGTGNDAKDPWVSQKYSISKTGLIWQDSE
ncbi:MAG: Ig-like domain-containing protein, partial [Bacteroidales bacterium]|nr:Ig-like domain-containing protein [Bacteroidales bacterium]